jgi:AraC-like DNA-binding protein
MPDATSRYLRFPPKGEERTAVEHLWMIESPGTAGPQREILIPNGRPTVVASLGPPGVRHDPLAGTSHPNGRVVFGITTRPFVLEQHGPASYVGAQLTPWGLAALLPGRHLIDEFLPLEHWVGPAALKELTGELAARPLGEERARALAAFLRTRLRPLPPGTLAALESAVGIVDRTGGQVTVAELAAKLGVSSSSVYRLFRHHLGVGPKQFCEITRYYRFTGGLLAEARGDSAALLANLNGYYDQAHATRDFRRFTGVTPTTFRQVHHGIARLMHATPEQQRA